MDEQAPAWVLGTFEHSASQVLRSGVSEPLLLRSRLLQSVQTIATILALLGRGLFPLGKLA